MFQRSSQTEPSSGPGSDESGVLTMTDPLAEAAESPGSASGGDETLRAVRKTKIRGTLVLVGVVAAGAGLLFTMRTLGVSKRLTFTDVKIDYPIERAESVVSRTEHERVIKALASSDEVMQVPLEQVQMNPFSLREEAEPELAGETGPSADELAAAKSAKEREARRKKLADALKALKLNSVVASGRLPVAQISGQVVRVGDIVAEEFIVGKINQRSVTLMADGQSFELEIGAGK